MNVFTVKVLWQIEAIEVETSLQYPHRLEMEIKAFRPSNKYTHGLKRIRHLHRKGEDGHWLQLEFALTEDSAALHLERTTYGGYIVRSGQSRAVDEMDELQIRQFAAQIIDGVWLAEQIARALSTDDWTPPDSQLLTGGIR